MKTVPNFHKLDLKLLPHLPQFPNMTLAIFSWCQTARERELAETKFSHNEEILDETAAYFEAKD